MRTLYADLDEDAVTDVLATLRVHSTVYCRTELGAPWGFGVRPAEMPIFHVISHGACWLEVDEVEEPVGLETGDVVLLMTGRGHRLCDDLSSKTEWLDEILQQTPPADGRLVYGGNRGRTEMICGCFRLEGAEASPLVLSLPPLLRLEGANPTTSEWVRALLTMLRVEVDQPRPGREAMLARLADVLITQAIRTFLISIAATDQAHVGALRDSRVAKAIRLFNADPSRAWTVEDMAAEVAMSRSSFAAVFRQLTGESPMRYLTRCRLARAASYLATTDLTVFAIAQRIGYDSEAALTKAFSRTLGIAPGAYRRQIRQRPATDILRPADLPTDGNGEPPDEIRHTTR